MNGQEVTVIAELKAKKGKEEDLRQFLLGLIEPSRADQGCIAYFLHESAEEPGLFMFYERWENGEMLESHIQQPHLQALMDKSDELLAEPLDVTSWKRLA
ncbi:Putative monooxygenase [Anaerohalosphaera lusitana]|uniref:Putative monooxygenase n=1 Tax=Anaerohalosphaera lusitana TaxID=1936003 RepID=A0A1U9NHK7_9BACT|nr:putative quinol monooxygenase [Anaerohalosphaera lusitana]AQT66996.1 Putative monooxygenase [Anaerohalosphaera lusitana]